MLEFFYRREDLEKLLRKDLFVNIYSKVFLALVVACFGISCAASGSKDGTSHEEGIPWMMTQAAGGIAFDIDKTPNAHAKSIGAHWSGRMTLTDVNPDTIWMADRPYRRAFEMKTTRFTSRFPDIFTKETGGSPNATVSWAEHKSHKQHFVVVEVSDPKLEGNDLTYTVVGIPYSEDEHGAPAVHPNEYIPSGVQSIDGTVSLFIDPWVESASGERVWVDPVEHHARPVFVGFSGGGWHSHTSSAGWVAGTLDSLYSIDPHNADLVTMFQNTTALAGNSGGNWFLSMLAWSDGFSGSMNTMTGRNNWFSNSGGGYMGQLEAQINLYNPTEDLDNDLLEGLAVISDDLAGYIAVGKMSTPDRSTFNMNQLEWTRGGVYSPAVVQDMANKRMNVDPTVPWAAEKDVILVASLMTEGVVLSNFKEDPDTTPKGHLARATWAPIPGRKSTRPGAHCFARSPTSS